MEMGTRFRNWLKSESNDFRTSGLNFSEVEKYLSSRPNRNLASACYPSDRHEVTFEWWSGRIDWTYELINKKYRLVAIDSHELTITSEGECATLQECREVATERAHAILLDWFQYLEEGIKNKLSYIQKSEQSGEDQGLLEDLHKALALVQGKISNLRRVGRPTTLPEPWRGLACRLGSAQRLADRLGTSLGTVRRWAKRERNPRGPARKLIEQLFEEAGLESPLMVD